MVVLAGQVCSLGLIREKKSTALVAMQLCLLLLPQVNRARLHTLIRFIHDASQNRELILSRSKTNFDEVLSIVSIPVPSPYYCPQSAPPVHTTSPGSYSTIHQIFIKFKNLHCKGKDFKQ